MGLQKVKRKKLSETYISYVRRTMWLHCGRKKVEVDLNVVRMRCPNCHHTFSIQTKVLREEPSLVALSTGYNVDVKELILQLKDKCAQCKNELIVVVHSHKIIAVYTWSEFKREGLFGSVKAI